MTLAFSPTAFASSDLDEAMDFGTRVFYPHVLTQVDKQRDFSMELVAGRAGALTIGQLRLGSETVADCTDVEDSYAMSIPLRGRVDVRTPNSDVTSSPDVAAITGPVGSVRLHGWAAGQEPVILLKFEKSTLEAELGRMLGGDPPRPVQFAPTLNLASGRGLQWRQYLDLLTAELTDPGALLWSPLMSERLTSMVVSGLLLSADHQYRDALDARVAPIPPATIRRAVAFIDEHLHEAITVSMIASAIGVSVRALERGFARHHGTSPRRYLERARLAKAHSDLLIETPATASVATIASRWGFAHYGRFANVYRAAYGCAPHVTLRDH